MVVLTADVFQFFIKSEKQELPGTYWPHYNLCPNIVIPVESTRLLSLLCKMIIMRRASEASLFFLGFPRKNKPLQTGSYEHRVPKIKNKAFFCTRYVCVIQHRNWPLRSTILNAHVTNASPDGLCTRTHTNEAFSCWFCCKSLRVDRARRGNVCLAAWLGCV